MIHAHITFLYISALPVFGSVHVRNVCILCLEVYMYVMYVCTYVCMHVQPEMDVYIFSYRDNCS